eukprot:CAMPEP_0172572246 /NCGR_PEP_ID=MMETSP1067-20121228/134420_1 /TAXON_ID=265564 ORGANISM="Thalassiosira punctigera, Strain Tpunct2005C2" /NCGR_SAMPLE_ID=MMETSP1067 /ASSEMBLY_ACC=CAM_ASM_000444 /LENGTH=130 /DNA_ID=CAMNT_0013364743 /DNA_START=327 /DNA_END=720 /DNA_ORIENTATION=+
MFLMAAATLNRDLGLVIVRESAPQAGRNEEKQRRKNGQHSAIPDCAPPITHARGEEDERQRLNAPLIAQQAATPFNILPPIATQHTIQEAAAASRPAKNPKRENTCAASRAGLNVSLTSAQNPSAAPLNW